MRFLPWVCWLAGLLANLKSGLDGTNRRESNHGMTRGECELDYNLIVMCFIPRSDTWIAFGFDSPPRLWGEIDWMLKILIRSGSGFAMDE